MNRIVITVSLIILFFTSCKILSPTVMFETEKDFVFTEFDNKKEPTIIQPYDQLRILMVTNDGTTLLESSSIFTNSGANSNAGLNGYSNTNNRNQINGITYMVRQDSIVKLPMIGNIKLGGLNKDTAEVILEDKLGQFYQKPYIKLYIVNRNVIIFFEEGTIGQTVSIPEDGITLLDAIAQLGGLTANSRAYKIKLIRGDNTNPKVYNYNISNIDEFKKANFVLEANDIIYVDSKPDYVSKTLDVIQPYLLLISTAVLTYSIFQR